MRRTFFVDVTQRELLDHVLGAFFCGSADKTSLRNTAFSNSARPEVRAVLDDLPNRVYSSVLDVCSELHEIPFDTAAGCTASSAQARPQAATAVDA